METLIWILVALAVAGIYILGFGACFTVFENSQGKRAENVEVALMWPVILILFFLALLVGIIVRVVKWTFVSLFRLGVRMGGWMDTNGSALFDKIWR